jgi:hypothetical protein
MPARRFFVMRAKISMIQARRDMDLLDVFGFPNYTKETKELILAKLKKQAYPNNKKDVPYWMNPEPGLRLVSG